jgi:hypothetical protein
MTNSKSQKARDQIISPLTPSLFPRRLCRNTKNPVQTRWKRWSGEKVLERQPFTSEIQTLDFVEMTSLSASIDWQFLKDRILRLWNPTVSSVRTTIATQSHVGEGETG